MHQIQWKRSGPALLALVALVVSMLAAVGCGQDSTTATPSPAPTGEVYGGVDISTLTNKDLVMVSHFDPGVERDVNAFGATVKWWREKVGGTFTLKTVAADIYPTKVMAMIGAGAPPDIVMVDQRGWMPRMAVLNVLQPVDDLVDKADLLEREARLYDDYVWKGKHYAIFVAGAWGNSLWYNKTLFEANGLKTPREYWDEGNWTWDTFLEVAKELTQDTDKDGKTDQWGYAHWGVELFPWSNNASMTQVNEDGTVDVIWNEEPFVQAAQFEQDLINTYKVWAPDLGFHVQGFKAGKVGMSAGANDFVKAFCAGMKDEVDNAPFPLGPNNSMDDLSYIGYSLFLGIGNGSKNVDGVRAFFGRLRPYELEFDEKDVVDPESNYAVLTEQQIETCEFVDSKVVLKYESGFGDWENKRWGFWGDILFQGVPVATALAMHQSTLEGEIKATLESKFVEIKPFTPVPAETFESGDPTKVLLTQDSLPEGSAAVGMSLVTEGALNGTTSLQFQYPDTEDWQILARTDETKIELPSYHRYIIKFKYRLEGPDTANIYFTIRPKATLESDEVSFGFLRATLAAGEPGTFEGYVDVLDVSENNVLLLIGENKAMTLTLDDFEIVEG